VERVLTHHGVAEISRLADALRIWCNGDMLPRMVLACCLLASVASGAGFSLLTYNADGDCGTCPSNWNISLPLVAAQGRELMYLKPDIVTFVEIPQGYTYQMTNFVNAFLPGYYVATNSRGDGFLTSVTVSRYPILQSASYLHGTSLAAFGATGHNFTRDLFEASISIPNFPKPVDVFSTHLKATTSSPATDALRRAAEAASISNWFVSVYLPTNGGRLYTLSGDLNEDIARPGNNYTSGHPIQTLTSGPAGLQLTTPLNPYNASELTIDIQSTLDARFDYILPCPQLYSNIANSQVFRSDLIPSPPAPLQAGDSKAASDHLPVMMGFNNPYDQPFRVVGLSLSNQLAALQWETTSGRQYRVETSTNLAGWTVLASNLSAAGTNDSFSTNVEGGVRFFRVYRLP
jgi:endonuclease/exonuclease/phosphatase family metal-dependent hydrolase